MKRREDDDRAEFPPELAEYRAEDGWTDHGQWWDARVRFAEEHGVYGRLPSGKGRILPMLQELAARVMVLIGALAALAVAMAPLASADPDADFLSGSTDALIVGATSIGDPGAGYIADTLNDYLDPAGFGGNASDVKDVVYPASENFGPSVAAGESALTKDVLAYFGCTNVCTSTEIASHAPLTLDGYSQGASVISGDEQTLANDGIPSDALRILMIGDTSSTQPEGAVPGFGPGFLDAWPEQGSNAQFLTDIGWGTNPPAGSTDLITDLTPNNLYPTEVFTLQGDYYGDYGVNGTDTSLLLGLPIHEAYLGLTQAEIDSATTVVDGMTTYYDIPALTGPDLWSALIDSLGAL
jgi:hypothetical protein